MRATWSVSIVLSTMSEPEVLAAVCFGSGLDAAGFVCLRFYAGITKGEVKNVTRDS